MIIVVLPADEPATESPGAAGEDVVIKDSDTARVLPLVKWDDKALREPERIAVTYASGESYTVTVRGHESVVDQPGNADGHDLGPTPVELFVASLAACVAYSAGRFLQRHHLRHEGLRVEAEFDMAEDRPARVAAVRIRVVTPVEISIARREALRAVVSRCTAHNSLRRPPDVGVRIK